MKMRTSHYWLETNSVLSISIRHLYTYLLLQLCCKTTKQTNIHQKKKSAVPTSSRRVAQGRIEGVDTAIRIRLFYFYPDLTYWEISYSYSDDGFRFHANANGDLEGSITVIMSRTSNEQPLYACMIRRRRVVNSNEMSILIHCCPIAWLGQYRGGSGSWHWQSAENLWLWG